VGKSFKIAAVSAEGYAGPIEKNLENLKKILQNLKKKKVKIALFPEGYLTGFTDSCWGSDHAWKNVLTLNSPEIKEAVKIIRQAKIYVSFGFWEDKKGTPVMSQLLVGPKGIIGHQQKTHPAEGYNSKAEKNEVIDLGFCRVGTIICKDAGYPEAAKVLSLKGADIILRAIAGGDKTKKGRPQADEFNDSMATIRAYENCCYFIQTNWSGSFTRVSDNSKRHFMGYAAIADPNGKIIAHSKGDFSANQIIIAEVDVDKYNSDRLWQKASRVPAVYGQISSRPVFETLSLSMEKNVFFKKYQVSAPFPIKTIKKATSAPHIKVFSSPELNEALISKKGFSAKNNPKSLVAESVYVNLYDFFGPLPKHAVYLVTQYNSSKKINMNLHVMGSDAAEVWMNGKQVTQYSNKNIGSSIDTCKKISLKKGENIFLIKSANERVR